MLQVQKFTFSPVEENTYVLYNEEKDAIIIDPGCYFCKEEREFEDFIEKNGLRPIYLFQTHCHLDHVFGSKWVHNRYGLEMYLHKEEEKMLEMAPVSGKKYGLAFDNYAGKLHYIPDSATFIIGNDTLETFFTPGHSPGSITFYCKEQGFAIVGDVLFHRSIGRTDLPFGDFSILSKSIRTHLYTLPNDTIIYSGHGPETTIGEEKKENPFVKG